MTLTSIKKRADFLVLQQKGSKWVSKSFTLQICPNEQLGQRYGLIVTKKLHKLAVNRNRVKRRLRSLIHEILPEKAANHTDFAFIARQDTISKPYDEMKKDLIWCLKRLEVLKEE
ncbi:MAG: ribonuclease P protein component [Pseudomonadota bacterium]